MLFQQPDRRVQLDLVPLLGVDTCDLQRALLRETGSPASVIASVDFPEPLGPTTATRPPAGTANETACSVGAAAPGHRTVTSRSTS